MSSPRRNETPARAVAGRRQFRARSSLAVAVAVLTVTLSAGCGSSSGTDQPAVCDSLEAVRLSVDHLQDTNVSENGLSALKSNLNTLKVDLDQLVADAKTQFGSQTDGVRSALQQLEASVEAARSDPSVTTFADVRTALTGVGDATRSLGETMSETC
jgi:hypothetical protein